MEQPPEEYKFFNLWPHAEDPISKETYDELDRLIREANEQLGIGERDFSHAHSPGNGSAPEISLSRHEIPDGSTLAVTFTDEMGTSRIMNARNDAGTPSAPQQPAAEVIEHNNSLGSYIARAEDESLSATEFEAWLAIVRDRTATGDFQKKRYIPHILALAT